MSTPKVAWNGDMKAVRDDDYHDESTPISVLSHRLALKLGAVNNGDYL